MRDLPDWLQGGPLTSLLSMPYSPVRSEIQRPIRLEFESDSIKSSLWSSKIPAAPVFYLGFLVFLHPGINTGLEKNAFKGSNLKLTKSLKHFFSYTLGWLDFTDQACRPQWTLTFRVNVTFLDCFQQNPLSNDLTKMEPMQKLWKLKWATGIERKTGKT